MWFLTVLESLHAIHLLHAVCSGLEDILARSAAQDAAGAAWSAALSNHKRNTADVANATLSTTSLLPELFESPACASELLLLEPDCERDWHEAEGPDSLSILLCPFAQLAAVLLFEIAMNTSTRFSRGFTSKVLLGILCAVAAFAAGYERVYASLIGSGGVGGGRGVDLSLMLSSAENLCLPLHLSLQIFLETAQGQQLCKEHFRRSGRRRWCCGERRADKLQ